MSMTGRYLRVDSSVIESILDSPSTLLDVLYPEPESADHTARYLDIDKTWHIIHFLLNNHAWEGRGPLFGAVLGGTELTDEDLGYGPARYLTPANVGATAQAIQQVSFNELCSWRTLPRSRLDRRVQSGGCSASRTPFPRASSAPRLATYPSAHPWRVNA